MLFSFSSDCLICEEEKEIPIVVNGDKVEYFRDEKKVVGSGNIVIEYEDVKLTCDKVEVFLDTKKAIAEGNVVVAQTGKEFFAEKVIYDFGIKEGEIINAALEADPYYGKGERIEKINEDKYVITRGYITTCDLTEHPHYRIQAKRIEIYPKNKVVARHILFFIKDIPVFYFPYFSHSLKDKRPFMTIIPGYNSEWGAYLLGTMRQRFSEKHVVDVHLDYRERRDFAGGVDYKYDTTYFGEGILRSYYMKERKMKEGHIWDKGEIVSKDERYRIQLRHKWQIDPYTFLVIEGNKLSDKEIIKDYFYREYERDEEPETYATLFHGRDNYSIELTAKKQVNDFFTTVEKLPEVNVEIYDTKIYNTDFYYSGSYYLSNFNKKFADDEYDDLHAARFYTDNKLSYMAKLFGIVSVNPYVGTKQIYYSKNIYEVKDQIRGEFYTGVDLSTKFYKIYDVETDFLGLDINKLRHIVTPTLKYYYKHAPTISDANLVQFDDSDSIVKAHGVTLGLENKLQTKRQNSKGDEETVELARLFLSTDYLYQDPEGSYFSDITGEFEARPYNWMYMYSKAIFDTETDEISKFDFDIGVNSPNSKRWTVALGYRYEISNISQITCYTRFQLNDKWNFRTYHRIDIRDYALQEQEYGVERDLHCWVMQVVYNHRQQQDHTLWLVFRLKAFPEMPLQFTTSYRGPRTESGQ